MINLRLTSSPIADDLDRLINKITNPGSRQRRMIGGAIRQGFQDNITSEGAASGERWPDLADVTVSTRQQLGFAGAHPMLVRTGKYRASFVDEGADGHVSETQRSGNGVTYVEGTDMPRARLHEFGGTTNIPSRQEKRGGGFMHVGGARGVYVPARPIVPLGEKSENRIFSVIELMISQVERDVLGG